MRPVFIIITYSRCLPAISHTHSHYLSESPPFYQPYNVPRQNTYVQFLYLNARAKIPQNRHQTTSPCFALPQENPVVVVIARSIRASNFSWFSGALLMLTSTTVGWITKSYMLVQNHCRSITSKLTDSYCLAILSINIHILVTTLRVHAFLTCLCISTFNPYDIS